MSPEVLNKRNLKGPVDGVYVGRPSKWGNPFQIGIDGTREEVILMYRSWYFNSPLSPKGDIEELRGKDLICWCAPLPCHAEFLMGEANA